MSWFQLHQQILKGHVDLQRNADQKLAADNASPVVMQADAHATSGDVPVEAEWLARHIPDVNEHTSAARLIRCLLHPDPYCRSTAQQALEDDFLQP